MHSYLGLVGFKDSDWPTDHTIHKSETYQWIQLARQVMHMTRQVSPCPAKGYKSAFYSGHSAPLIGADDGRKNSAVRSQCILLKCDNFSSFRLLHFVHILGLHRRERMARCYLFVVLNKYLNEHSVFIPRLSDKYNYCNLEPLYLKPNYQNAHPRNEKYGTTVFHLKPVLNT